MVRAGVVAYVGVTTPPGRRQAEARRGTANRTQDPPGPFSRVRRRIYADVEWSSSTLWLVGGKGLCDITHRNETTARNERLTGLTAVPHVTDAHSWREARMQQAR